VWVGRYDDIATVFVPPLNTGSSLRSE